MVTECTKTHMTRRCGRWRRVARDRTRESVGEGVGERESVSDG